MPNVAGREFSYTPQGKAAAEQYKQSLGMRGGRMMGFRPVGYQDGGDSDAVATAKELYALMSDGSEQEVIAYINLNRANLEAIAALDDPMFNMLRSVLSRHPQGPVPTGIPVSESGPSWIGPKPPPPFNTKMENDSPWRGPTPEQVREVNKPWRGAGYPGSAMEEYHQSGTPLEHPGVDAEGSYFPPEYFDPPDVPADVPIPRRNPLRTTGEGIGMRQGGIMSLRRR